MIEFFATFNIKRFPDELVFGDFHNQPIPPDYYDFLTDYDDSKNNIPDTPVGDVLPYIGVVEYVVFTNYEGTNDNIIIDDADSLT